MDAVDEHKLFIEKMVRITPSLTAQLVRTKAIYSPARGYTQHNELIEQLPIEHRECLASMLERERSNAIFDALVTLHETLAIRGWSMSVEGAEIPAEPYGYTMFEEYITLLQDERGWSALT